MRARTTIVWAVPLLALAGCAAEPTDSAGPTPDATPILASPTPAPASPVVSPPSSAPSVVSATPPAPIPPSPTPASPSPPPPSPSPTPPAPASPSPPAPTPSPSPTVVSPAPPAALRVTASASPESPCQSAKVTVTVVVREDGGAPVAGADVDSTWRYRTTTSHEEGTTDASGTAYLERIIGRATPGHTVQVSVTATSDGRTGTAGASFTPRDC